MESTLYHSNIYSSAAGAPSPYMAPSFAEQQLPPLPQYRQHNTMFGTTTTTATTRSPYPSSSPYHHPYTAAAAGGHGAAADLATNGGGADPYAPAWSSSPFMSPPTSLAPPPSSYRGVTTSGGGGRYGPSPAHHHLHHHHHHPSVMAGFPGAPCSPTDTGSMAGAAPIQRPKLTTTVWEDEGTLCYQVDAKNICVARRQDNDMVNGTKLLNVVGMSRGKRDGILKNEKGRVVVKVGAMHLKGVWITFSRAKDLATKFKILDVLYPLFTDDPSMFLCASSSSASGGTALNNDSTLSNSSSSSNGVPVTSDTASVETAQTSSTVKSLAHTSTNLPPPMPYKAADTYNSMISSSWMDQRSYQQQQSLPSISSADGLYRSQICSPVPSAVAPVCSSEESYGMFSQTDYDYRSMGRSLAEPNVFSSSAYDGSAFLSHKPDFLGDVTSAVTRYPNSPPSDKSYGLDELPIPQQPTSIYGPRHHDLESAGSPDEHGAEFAGAATTTGVSEEGSAAIVPESSATPVASPRKRKSEDDLQQQQYSNLKKSQSTTKRVKSNDN